MHFMVGIKAICKCRSLDEFIWLVISTGRLAKESQKVDLALYFRIILGDYSPVIIEWRPLWTQAVVGDQTTTPHRAVETR